MYRKVLRWRIIRAGASLLVGALLVVVFIHHRIIHLQEKGRQMKAPIKKSWSRCEQNLTAAKINGFKYIPPIFQDFLYYRHCRHFPMLLDIPDKCADESEDIFLLLVIKSSPLNYDRREVLRKTWAKERLHNGVWIRRIFISGTMDAGVGKEKLNKLLKLEQREHNDILQWDFNESLFNLTLKQILFFEWMERNCGNVRFLLNGDDDVFANTDNMVEYLQSLKDNDGSKHLFTGQVILNASPIRRLRSKYFVPFQVYSETSYPPYCGGGGFLLSFYTALIIHKMSKSIMFIPIDDVYIGMCLAKAKLKPISHEGVKTIELDITSGKQQKFDPCYVRELLLVHQFPPADMSCGTQYMIPI